MLIKRKADPNVVDSDDNTPLHFVMSSFIKNESKYRAIAESLVFSGSKPNIRNKELWAPLHIAARKGMIEAVRWAIMINKILISLEMEPFNLNLQGGS